MISAYCHTLDDAKLAAIFYERCFAYEPVFEGTEENIKKKIKEEIHKRNLGSGILELKILSYNGKGGTTGFLIDLNPEKQANKAGNNQISEKFVEFSSNENSHLKVSREQKEVIFLEFLGINNVKKQSKKNEIKAIDFLLDNVSLIDKDNLDWEQVIEFRKDVSSIRKVRMIRYFVLEFFKNHPKEQVADIIEMQLEDYENAIKKHGILTRTGLLKQLIDSKNLSSLAIGGGIPTVLGNEMLGLATAGIIAIGNAAIYLKEKQIERKNLLLANHDTEISMIYEIKKQLNR
ncbi:MAG: hypothetical protein WBG90_13370 [Saonia sp.]